MLRLHHSLCQVSDSVEASPGSEDDYPAPAPPLLVSSRTLFSAVDGPDSTGASRSRLGGPGPGTHANRTPTEGDERRDNLTRYWRYREWTRHPTLNTPVELPEQEEMELLYPKLPVVQMEKRPSCKAVKEKTNDKPDETKDDDDIPKGFRWVTIKIV